MSVRHCSVLYTVYVSTLWGFLIEHLLFRNTVRYAIEAKETLIKKFQTYFNWIVSPDLEYTITHKGGLGNHFWRIIVEKFVAFSFYFSSLIQGKFYHREQQSVNRIEKGTEQGVVVQCTILHTRLHFIQPPKTQLYSPSKIRKQCWKFRTMYGGYEPSRKVVPARQATYIRLAESIPWNRFLDSLNV